MTPDYSVVRTWLLRSPRPHMVRVTDAEGETHDVDIPPNPRWADVAKGICNLDPVRVVALSGDDRVLRVEKYGEVQGEAAGPAPAPAPVEAPRYASQVAPVSTDPETIRSTHVANLLADAHREGYSGMRYALDALSSIVRSQDERYNALSKRLDETAEKYQEDVYERLEDVVALVEDRLQNRGVEGDESGDFKTDVMKAFFQGFQGSKAATNGKAS